MPPSRSASDGVVKRTQVLAGRALRAVADLGARALRAADDLAGYVSASASARFGRKLRVPTWTLVAVISVPLVCAIAWLALRGPAAAPGAIASGAPVARLEQVLAPTAEPAPTAVASVAASIRAAPTAGAASNLEALDATALRSRLRDFANARDWARAGKAVEALAKAEPAALGEPSIASSVASIAVALETTGGEDADAMFDLLSARSGTQGLAILFDIVRARGGTKASQRAATLLRKPEVFARLPPPVSVAFALRDAPCDKKPDLYARAVAEGDHLALTELRVMREADCDRRRRPDDPCCFDKTPLDNAIKDLRAKLAK